MRVVGSLPEQINRFRSLAEVGVARAFVPVPGLSNPDDLDIYADLIAAFG